MAKKHLREGFTTGSAAAAGAKAGILFLAGQGPVKEVDIPLPIGGRLTIPIANAVVNGTVCFVTVIKNAGDDPDVTHKAKIESIVRLLPEDDLGSVIIEGGKGVGKVTRPGLPVPVGEAAINPIPRRQIKEAVLEGLEEAGLKSAVSVTIEVAYGEKIAKKTLNPRLGIIGGISILGTQGTVKPFSNKSYKDTITMSMDVARATGSSTIVLSTGGKSERFVKEQRPDFPETSFIQVADFFSFSLKQATKKGFTDILYACFFGKLVKMAQGHTNTHARKSRIDFDMLASWCLSIGMENKSALQVAGANTAHQALSVIRGDIHREKILNETLKRALISARGFVGPGPNITYYLFGFGGDLLSSLKDKGKHLS